MHRIDCVDSHTGGEPTRVVLSGQPDLDGLSLAQAVEQLRARHDHLRRAVVCEPRGSDVMVGAWLLPARSPGALASVVFFNNVGYLGMCGHGTIGVLATLAHLGRVAPGRHRLDTPVGPVQAELHADGSVSIENVPAYRHRQGVMVQVDGRGPVRGDVAWGGNWFFLCPTSTPLTLDHAGALTAEALAIRAALAREQVCGRDGAEIDHIELTGPAGDPAHHGRNFVLCPGAAYDRSPCGTGTSAKLACLAADGELAEGQDWWQESVLGSVFKASYRRRGAELVPTITGRAHVTARSTLLLDPADPFCWGLA